jgi:hypothetical protein
VGLSAKVGAGGTTLSLTLSKFEAMEWWIVVRLFEFLRFLKYSNFKIFQNQRTIGPNYLKNLSEILVFLEELIKKTQRFYCRLFDFLKKFDNHGYIHIFVFLLKNHGYES